MSDVEARLVGLVSQVSRSRADAYARNDEMVLSMLAGESATIFGKRVEFTLSWPDGLPLNFTEEAALREYAADWLAQSRERRRAAREAP